MINTKIVFTIKTDKDGNVNLGYSRKNVAKPKTEQEENFLKYVEMLIKTTLSHGLGLKGGEDGNEMGK